MSEKELLYIDDALGHCLNIYEFLQANIDCVTDENFKVVLNEFDKVNSDCYKKLYRLNK